MKTSILLNIDNPGQLKKLYRQNKSGFKQQFSMVYPELKENKLLISGMKELNYESEDVYFDNYQKIIYNAAIIPKTSIVPVVKVGCVLNIELSTSKPLAFTPLLFCKKTGSYDVYWFHKQCVINN